MQTDTDSLHQTPQSDPDSQTDLLQDRNNASGYSAAQSLHHNTAFAVFGILWKGAVRTGRRRSRWCNHQIAVNLIV